MSFTKVIFHWQLKILTSIFLNSFKKVLEIQLGNFFIRFLILVYQYLLGCLTKIIISVLFLWTSRGRCWHHQILALKNCQHIVFLLLSAWVCSEMENKKINRKPKSISSIRNPFLLINFCIVKLLHVKAPQLFTKSPHYELQSLAKFPLAICKISCCKIATMQKCPVIWTGPMIVSSAVTFF